MDADGLSEIEHAARALLDTRVEAVRALAVAAQHAADQRQAADAAERQAAQAWSAAVNAGWSPDELRKLKFTAPASGQNGRRRRSRTRTTDTD